MLCLAACTGLEKLDDSHACMLALPSQARLQLSWLQLHAFIQFETKFLYVASVLFAACPAMSTVSRGKHDLCYQLLVFSRRTSDPYPSDSRRSCTHCSRCSPSCVCHYLCVLLSMCGFVFANMGCELTRLCVHALPEYCQLMRRATACGSAQTPAWSAISH